MIAARRAPKSCFVALLFLLALALVAPDGARAATRKKGVDISTPKTNILMIRKDGEAIDPDTSQLLDTPGKYVEYDKYIDRIFADLKEFCARQPPPCKVLFYFHGGLNGQESSVGRARDLTKTIREQGRREELGPPGVEKLGPCPVDLPRLAVVLQPETLR